MAIQPATTHLPTATAPPTEGLAEVLIVGAGPGGLSLAYFLHRLGVAVRIIDKDAGPTDGTRAPVLWQRTQEILAAAGLRDAWLAGTHPQTEESLHFYGEASAVVPLLDAASPYERPMVAPQAFTEQTLARCLAEAGLVVEYTTEAIGYAEINGRAEVRVRRAEGREETLAAQWVVAAEGAKSIIRARVGLDFDAQKYEGYRIHIADVTAEWTYPTPVGQGYFFIQEKAYLGGQRLPGEPNRFYFYILTVDDEPANPSNELDLAKMQQLVRDLTGDDQAVLSALHWGTTSRYRHGVAPSFRKGRALLLGDTAKIVIPLYGQGMNYAIHDAWNLAWKLQHVLRNWATDQLLDTYTDERRGLALQLDERITRTFYFITAPKPLQAPLMRTAVPLALSSEHLREVGLRSLSELDLSYAGLGLSPQNSTVGKLQAGDRMPALWTKQLPECASVNLLDLFDGTRWTLLLVHRAGADADQCHAEIAAASALAARYEPVLRAVVLHGGPRRPAASRLQTLVDAEERLARAQDLPAISALLVRPDGYLALVTDAVTAGVPTYLAHWLALPSLS
jgi:3-(3-hydroxy-phenyl)propionate hydroxylase